ncbi:glycosyl hydrolase [Paenibacillus sambharensis]|uniref:Glycosyl hydrolase n=1 Tax=Paenibacillus sambharensis TaxID=1803190 RepID=A0A2W1LHQ7_9BACL|nr:glycosyl hydrolase [Paenibacillus sambharensis]
MRKLLVLWLVFVLGLPVMLTAPSPNEAFAASDTVINLSAERQLIKGFGGMNHPSWAGDLSSSQRETAFGNGQNQLGFSIVRIYVDENSANWHKEVPTAKRAAELGALVIASPWNPPSHMVEKFNRNGDTNAKRLKYNMYNEYAQHLNNFVSFMANNGVDLYAISVQNEPDYAHEWTWWTPAEILTFMKNNAGSIKTRVISPESFQYLKNYYDPILNDPQALANMDILGAHLYGTSFNNFPYPLFKQKGAGKELWMTEVYYPNSDMTSGDRWPEALDVAHHIHHAMADGEFQAYIWWYIRRGYGPMREDGTISKRGYSMAHFSKFVRPGYKRVDATKNPNTNVFVSAYKGGNKVVIVAVNKGSSAVNQNFVLQNGSVSAVSRWVTKANSNLQPEATIQVTGNNFSANLAPQSITTFVADLSGGGSGGGSSTTYQAETGATLASAVTESNYSGYTGSGYVNFNAYSGASVQWNNIYCAITGTKNIKVRYALESGTRNLDVYVNGTKMTESASFGPTGSWSNWAEKTITVPMNTGTNTLRFVTNGTEGPNIDYIEVSAVE